MNFIQFLYEGELEREEILLNIAQAELDGEISRDRPTNCASNTTRRKKNDVKKKTKYMDADTDALYKAVQRYIENRGGKLLVIGGIEIIRLPSDGKYIFHFAVKCMGNPPQKAETE